MGGCRDLRDFLQQFQVFGMFAEFVIANQGAIRFATKKAVFFLIDLFEHRTLIEFRSPLQIAQQVLLRRVQNTNLQLRPGLRLLQQILESAPGGFQFLKLGVVQDLVQLKRNEMVDLCNPGGDHLVGIAAQSHRPFKHLRNEFLDQPLATLTRAGVSKPALFDNLVKNARLRGLFDNGRTASNFLGLRHWVLPSRLRT